MEGKRNVRQQNPFFFSRLSSYNGSQEISGPAPLQHHQDLHPVSVELSGFLSASNWAQDKVGRDPSLSIIDPNPVDHGIFRRFLNRRAILPLDTQLLPLGRENLLEKLRSLDISKDRIRLDGLIPSPCREMPPELTAEEARKVLRIAQMEMVKSKLREIREIRVPYDEIVRIYGGFSGSP